MNFAAMGSIIELFKYSFQDPQIVGSLRVVLIFIFWFSWLMMMTDYQLSVRVFKTYDT
jgi:hypothetical protein